MMRDVGVPLYILLVIPTLFSLLSSFFLHLIPLLVSFISSYPFPDSFIRITSSASISSHDGHADQKDVRLGIREGPQSSIVLSTCFLYNIFLIYFFKMRKKQK